MGSAAGASGLLPILAGGILMRLLGGAGAHTAVLGNFRPRSGASAIQLGLVKWNAGSRSVVAPPYRLQGWPVAGAPSPQLSECLCQVLAKLLSESAHTVEGPESTAVVVVPL